MTSLQSPVIQNLRSHGKLAPLQPPLPPYTVRSTVTAMSSAYKVLLRVLPGNTDGFTQFSSPRLSISYYLRTRLTL